MLEAYPNLSVLKLCFYRILPGSNKLTSWYNAMLTLLRHESQGQGARPLRVLWLTHHRWVRSMDSFDTVYGRNGEYVGLRSGDPNSLFPEGAYEDDARAASEDSPGRGTLRTSPVLDFFLDELSRIHALSSELDELLCDQNYACLDAVVFEFKAYAAKYEGSAIVADLGVALRAMFPRLAAHRKICACLTLLNRQYGRRFCAGLRHANGSCFR